MNHRTCILVLIIASIASFGLIPAFADHPLPRFDYVEHSCVATFHSSFWEYDCNWGFVNDGLANVPIIIIVEQEPDETTNDFMVRLKEQVSILTKPIPIPKEITPYNTMTPEIVAKLKEKQEELQERYEEVKKFCSYGVGAYHAIQVKEQFETINQLLQTVASDDYIGKELNKKYEACRIMKGYQSMIFQYTNLPSVDEGSIPTEEDMTDSPYTDPVTTRDIKDAVDDAFEELCTSTTFGNATKALYGCNVVLPTGIGGATLGAECQQWGQPAEIGSIADQICPLKKKLQWIEDNPTVDTELLALETLCNIFDASYGAIDENFQPKILRDGTCDNFLETDENGN